MDEMMGRSSSLKSIPEIADKNEKEKILYQEQEPCLGMLDFEPTLQKQREMQIVYAQGWLLQQVIEIESL
jgi:hypothetical protein